MIVGYEIGYSLFCQESRIIYLVIFNILLLLKVPMTWKIFSAYLKGLWKYRRMAFFLLKYLFSFKRYWRFSIMQIRSVMTSYCLQLKMVKYWINDISGNIEAVFLKLGTINVHHKRNTITPLMPLPWQQFGHWCCLNKNLNSHFLSETKNHLPHTIYWWELRQYGNCVCSK